MRKNFHHNVDEIPPCPNYSEKDVENDHNNKLHYSSVKEDLLVAYELLRMACQEIDFNTPDCYNNDISDRIKEYLVQDGEFVAKDK